MEILVLTASVWSQHRYENCVCLFILSLPIIQAYLRGELIWIFITFVKFWLLIAYNLVEPYEKITGFWGKLEKAERHIQFVANKKVYVISVLGWVGQRDVFNQTIWLILDFLLLLFCLKSDSVFYSCGNVDHTKWSIFCSCIHKAIKCENLIPLNQWLKTKTSTVTFICSILWALLVIMQYIWMLWDIYYLSDLFSVFLCVYFHTANTTSLCLRRKWK